MCGIKNCADYSEEETKNVEAFEKKILDKLSDKAYEIRFPGLKQPSYLEPSLPINHISYPQV